MRDPLSCSHESWQYARRIFPDGTQHIVAQCNSCLGAIKLQRHQNHLYLKLTDVPANSCIHPWIEGSYHE